MESARVLARRYREQLAALPDAEVASQLRRIVDLGDAGLPLLAAALGSPREAVRTAARGLLIEEADRWELLSPSVAATKLAILAKALAQSAEHFDAANKRLAADMAPRILNWPHSGGDDSGDDDAGRVAVMADCEAVLAATAAPHTAPLAATVRRKDYAVRRVGADVEFDSLAQSPSGSIAPSRRY